MNHTSIKKISLTTLALVAALAVSARANGPVMSAREHHGAAMPQHSMARVLLPDEVYQIDDGGSEDAVGLTLGGDVIALNQFDVIAGSETITSINMAWGTPAFPDPSLNGLLYTAVLWDDPNGDRSPTDSNVLATVDGVVANQGTDTFINNPITPTTIVGSSFFIGYIIQDTIGGQFPCAFDESAPIFNRSWVAGGATGDINNLNNNDLPVALIESFGLLGNWLCRADAGGGGGGLTLSGAFSEKGLFDIDLPLAGGGIEDRSGGPNKKYAIYFVVSGDLASVGGATTSCGSVSHFGPDPDVANQAEVDLVNVGCNATELTVTATNLVDTQGNSLASASVTFGLLIGDVNGDGVVDNNDRHIVKGDLGQEADQTNFRSDVATQGHNSTGFINNADVKLVERQNGTHL